MKILKLSINGKEETFNLGNNAFFEFFLEQTGVDLYKEGLVDYGSINMIKYVRGFLIAGDKANKLVNGGDVIPGLDRYVSLLDDSETAELFTQCIAIRAGKTVDELKNAIAQAEKQAA